MNGFLKSALFAAAALALLAFVFEDARVLVYLPNFAYHGVNLQAFVFRRTAAASFAVRSVGLRSLAFGLLAVLAVWSGELRLSAAGLLLLVGGLVLHTLAVRAHRQPRRTRGSPPRGARAGREGGRGALAGLF